MLVHLQVNIPVYFYLSAVVDCGSLEDPDNGQVNFSNTTFESTANYTCDLGYNLNGNITRTCEPVENGLEIYLLVNVSD